VSTLEIVIIAVLALLVLLAVLGFVAQRRRLRATAEQFRARVEQANHDLAEAHAADNGWEPARVEAAARAVFATRFPNEEITEIGLVQVIDRPGTDEDQAVFEVHTSRGAERITLGRRGETWLPAD
jgi:hypothetical protein